MKQPLFFRIHRDGQLVEIKQAQAAQVVFGSNDDVEVSLKDESVSPIHAMIEERDSGFFLCDLGSGGGTQKNGTNVLDEEIQSGDQIQIGPFIIEFYVGVPKPKSRPPRTGDAPVPPVASVAKDDIYDAPVAKPATAKPTAPAQTPKPATPEAKPTPSVDVSTASRSQKPSEPVVQAAKQDKSSNESWQKVEPAQKAKAKPTAGVAASGGLERVTPPGKGTYAPPSAIKDLKSVIKPSKGTVVEITVAWKERIIGTYHYDDKRSVTIGSHPKNDIVLPVFGSSNVSYPLLKVESLAKVFVTSDLKGEFIHQKGTSPLSQLVSIGRAEAAGAGSYVTLQQGELIRIDFSDSISIYVRYVSQSPKAFAGPLLGLSSSELSTLVGITVLLLFMAFYFAVYHPEAEVTEAKKPDEPVRKAMFVYKPQFEPTEVNQEEAKTPSPDAKLADKTTATTVKSPNKTEKAQKAASKEDEGKAAEAKPNKSKSKEVKLTTPNPGKNKGVQKGGVSAANKNDAQGASAQKDPTKTGLMSVLSGKGAQDKLAQAYSGSGVVGGLSKSATGSGSQSAVGAGDVPGEGLKEIGKGGTGEATVGIAGVGTKGRGSGNQGYGSGGIGDKKNATVIPGGAEESFQGTIDRDAIRRVIQENMRQIKACYERSLNKDPGLHGKVVLAWVIGDRGSVRQASVASSTMGNAEVEQCMVSRLRTWRFPEPPPGQEAEVTYPFVFTAQQ